MVKRVVVGEDLATVEESQLWIGRLRGNTRAGGFLKELDAALTRGKEGCR